MKLVRRGSYTASNPEPFAPMIKRMKASMKSLESGAPVEKAKLKEILDSVVHADYRLRTATSDEADLDDFRKTHWSLRSQLLSYITSQPKTDTDTSNMIVRIGEKICIPDLFPTRGQSKPTQNDINYAQEVLIQLRKKDRKWDLNDGSEARKKLKEGMYAAYVASGIKPTV
ncbi:hypothetical protein H0H93_011603 [Arthromyces matolae]|nr:hypothetical protein H0H93_011603 [Arthromyces matolae]